MAEQCVVCRQGTAHEVIEPDEVRVPGLTFVIEDDRRMRCERCAEEYYTGEQADEHQRKVDQRKREAYKPMEPAEIKALRARVNVSQRTFEDVMGLGANTLNRWERGAAVPNRLVDNLLRVVARDPEVLTFLAEHAGVQLTPKGRPGRKKAEPKGGPRGASGSRGEGGPATRPAPAKAKPRKTPSGG